MTLIEIFIVGACGYALWNHHIHRRLLSVELVGPGAQLITIGLAVIGLFFTAGILVTLALPFFMSASEAIAVKSSLYLDNNSYAAVLGLGLIAAGFVSNISKTSALVTDSQQTQMRFREIAEIANAWIWEMDEELRFTYLSDRFFEIVPIPNEDIIGKRHDELAANLTNDEAWRRYFHDVATRRPFSDFEYAILLPDRTTKYLVINGKPIFDSGGNFKGYRGTGSDRTARAAARTALDRTERQFRDLIEGSIQGLYIYRDGHLLFANQALADILGYENPEEILALEKIERFLGPAAEDQDSQNKPGRRTGEYEPEIYEARAIKKDGSATWLEFREKPIEWHDQPAMQCVVVDITERKKAEAALQQQTEELEQILRNVPRAIITIDENGFITNFNPAATDTFGYASEEIIGHNISLLTPADEADLHDRYVKAYLQSGDKKFIDNGPRQLTGRHKDGREFPMELAISQAGTGENGLVFVGVARDITEQKEAQSTLERHNEELRKRDEELHEQTKRFNAALENMSDGLCMFDSEKRLIVSNTRYASMYNVLPEQIAPGTTLREIIDLRVASDTYEESDAETYIEERQEWVDSGAKELNVRKLKDGRIIGISHQSMPDGGWLSTHVDITELREVQDQLSYLAHHDALTELPNRTLLLDRINDALTRTRRKRGFALLVLDLDGFKGVNDMLGHPAGDKLLRAAAERLRGCVREIDTVARLGGDEFAIVLTSTNRFEDVEALSGRICVELGAPFTMEDDRQVVVGASVGIAMAPTDGRDPHELLKKADMALYQAKEEGRGRYRFFKPLLEATTNDRHALGLDLRKALANDELELHYQPLINLDEDRVSGFEALLRWNHPERGMVLPNEFISIAEEIGLINQLGEWALHRAAMQAATWPTDIKVAVNVSPLQFRGDQLVATVTHALVTSNLAAERLELEITESVLLRDENSTLGILHELHDLGIRVSLDDFGTGYSSLSYLQSFPFNKIKIDASFINRLGEEEDGIGIVHAVTSMAARLNVATTAEGVETSKQLEILKKEGCTEAQGYYFSPPRPVKDITLEFIQSLGK